MHLLATTQGLIDDGLSAVDLKQSPGDIVFLSTADTDLSTLALAHQNLGSSAPNIRIANLNQLRHPMSIDLYVERTLAGAKLIIARLLGGQSYWPYGVEELTRLSRENSVLLVLLPGDVQPEEELNRLSNVRPDDYLTMFEYFRHGGLTNITNAIKFAEHLICGTPLPDPARPALAAGLYWPCCEQPSLEDIQDQWILERPVAAITFYRALMLSSQTSAIDALIEALAQQGLNALPVYAQSFKNRTCAAITERFFKTSSPSIVVNCTGFALTKFGSNGASSVFDSGTRPVLQAMFAGIDRAAWTTSTRGLGARDIAMNVALPEVDGRIITRAIAFKQEIRFDTAIQASVVTHAPDLNRTAFVAALAAAWVRLATTPKDRRRVAIVLANYPNRDGRIGNGVGLDTPASVAFLTKEMGTRKYRIGDAPTDGRALMQLILSGPTNAIKVSSISTGETLSLETYQAFFNGLPNSVQSAVCARWGDPQDDIFVRDGYFHLAIHRFENLIIAIQPARGYNVDPKKTYHDPDLVPPHAYFAFYAWIRNTFQAHAIIQVGKHGNLEWLPGKALSLSDACFPEAALGPLPVIYPFIVNDPGEGTQAKRRTSSVIIDHLTPPLTRAETYGPLRELEVLLDEYYEASLVDQRRSKELKKQIFEHAAVSGLDRDCKIEGQSDDGALSALDAHLCDLKELQIRDGLHILGNIPTGSALNRYLIALTRVPRAGSTPGDASIIRAIAADLGLTFDPLSCDLASNWSGKRPPELSNITSDNWRSTGDTLERIEILAEKLIAEQCAPAPEWSSTQAVLETINTVLRPAITESGSGEINGIFKALDGGFVNPGPSGAPSRGRADVLPTGRNFYSLDSRSVPTETAWMLGEKSARFLAEDFRQRNGSWPQHLALSAWGTANMRTGGDDIAQALALIGARPLWERASGRVTGFEILPIAELSRPRIDVTLRVSGFFRDAFPTQIELFDSAVRAIGALNEGKNDNPLAARMQHDRQALESSGMDKVDAKRHAGYRVFSSMPGAYGAGLQALIDENIWEIREDFAKAYVSWSAYAYGAGSEGEAVGELFTTRLSHIEAVVHNQDNREHDLLDSDDYYQFEGGLSAAVEQASGVRPLIYHNDHSRPEQPKIRTLEDEIARVVRARAVNPKWIAGVMRHGYKGAFELAATVDYLYAFQATTGAVADHHFDLIFDAYLGDLTVRNFIAQENPPALLEMADRFRDALRRGLWHPRANHIYDILENIKKA
jgi:cobaltochelatase CobN